jgi:DNA-binding NtrC family response regulator
MPNPKPTRLKILIVDDDTGILVTLEDLLSEENFEVHTTSDPVAAIQKVREHSFHVVLLDVKMPGKNGVELLQEIKGIKPSQCVIMMTAFAEEDLESKANEGGALQVIYKPLDIRQLIETLHFLILIVDDEAGIRETLTEILEDRGFKVASAESGREAIDLLRKKRFNVIFLDVKMPDLDGLETFVGLRQIRPAVRVVMMSGYGQEVQGKVSECISRSAYTFVPKPFEPVRILKIIEDIRSGRGKPFF